MGLFQGTKKDRECSCGLDFVVRNVLKRTAILSIAPWGVKKKVRKTPDFAPLSGK